MNTSHSKVNKGTDQYDPKKTNKKNRERSENPLHISTAPRKYPTEPL